LLPDLDAQQPEKRKRLNTEINKAKNLLVLPKLLKKHFGAFTFKSKQL
tara:strand:- start:429 stop:572 length:144 start_codon:yes stop_codon:yes gene_type:complete